MRAVHGVPGLTAEIAVVHRRAAEPAARQQSIAGDHTDTHPALALVQAFGLGAGGCRAPAASSRIRAPWLQPLASAPPPALGAARRDAPASSTARRGAGGSRG